MSFTKMSKYISKIRHLFYASYISVSLIHNTQSAQISQMQDGHNIYAIVKTMCPPGYHHNGFVATHALGHTAIVLH